MTLVLFMSFPAWISQAFGFGGEPGNEATYLHAYARACRAVPSGRVKMEVGREIV